MRSMDENRLKNFEQNNLNIRTQKVLYFKLLNMHAYKRNRKMLCCKLGVIGLCV